MGASGGPGKRKVGGISRTPPSSRGKGLPRRIKPVKGSRGNLGVKVIRAQIETATGS